MRRPAAVTLSTRRVIALFLPVVLRFADFADFADVADDCDLADDPDFGDDWDFDDLDVGDLDVDDLAVDDERALTADFFAPEDFDLPADFALPRDAPPDPIDRLALPLPLFFAMRNSPSCGVMQLLTNSSMTLRKTHRDATRERQPVR